MLKEEMLESIKELENHAFNSPIQKMLQTEGVLGVSRLLFQPGVDPWIEYYLMFHKDKVVVAIRSVHKGKEYPGFEKPRVVAVPLAKVPPVYKNWDDFYSVAEKAASCETGRTNGIVFVHQAADKQKSIIAKWINPGGKEQQPQLELINAYMEWLGELKLLPEKLERYLEVKVA